MNRKQNPKGSPAGKRRWRACDATCQERRRTVRKNKNREWLEGGPDPRSPWTMDEDRFSSN